MGFSEHIHSMWARLSKFGEIIRVEEVYICPSGLLEGGSFTIRLLTSDSQIGYRCRFSAQSMLL